MPAFLFLTLSLLGSVVSTTLNLKDENCQSSKGLRLTKGTQPYCSCQVHLFVSLSDCWCVCCSQQLWLFVVSLSCAWVFSQDVSIFPKKGGGNHTRQELIFQAANSHSRWSSFFLPKWKDRMKALTLYVVLGGTELMRLFSASGALLCLCVFLSFYFTLFTPLLISPHLPLSIYTGRRRYAQWRAARGLIQFWITFSSSGLVSLVWSLYLLFLFCMLYISRKSFDRKKFSLCQGVPGKDASFLAHLMSISHYIIEYVLH